MINQEEVIEAQQLEIKKMQTKRIQRICCLCVLILLVGAVAFSYFSIKSQSKLVLREAKNVAMALNFSGIEQYSKNQKVYDIRQADGISPAVEKEIRKLLGCKGEIQLSSYDEKNQKVLAMTYSKGRYQVIYRYEKGASDSWKVNYYITVME